ncbi:helix-turn-helix transcriptional regulator [Streptomyces sp. 7-21]|uniref:helix-turn-helix domain-containing protein n=1 Tax=Streptomyces sp. 7-21 TaxID=2802283 RepID=UPI0027DBD34E|nr:helix-turn-helix transcriptional regulator [Streptomyces sp. 7-21]
MSAKTGPAQRLQLARALARLRERAGLTQAGLAERADVSKQTVTRYETWRDRAGINWKTVRDLARACDATTEEVDAVVRLARSPHPDGWWAGHTAVPAWLDPLMSFEDWATYEHVFANSLVPGLLQTPAYAKATQQAAEVRSSAQEIEQWVEQRLRRQAVLQRERSFHLWAVLDEAVLRRIVGDATVMAEQLEHLMEASEKPNVEVQVMPFSAGATAAGAGHFLVVGRDDRQMRVVYVELRRRGLYLDDEEDVSAYALAFDYLRSQARDAKTSIELLHSIRREYLR